MLAQQACWDGPYLSRHHDQRHVAEVAAACQTKEELWSLLLNSTQGRIIGPRKNLRPASNPKILEKSREDSQAHRTPCPNSSSHCSFFKITPDPAINALWREEDWRRTLIASKDEMGCTHMAIMSAVDQCAPVFTNSCVGAWLESDGFKLLHCLHWFKKTSRWKRGTFIAKTKSQRTGERHEFHVQETEQPRQVSSIAKDDLSM